ncbi:MAG TPA: hypothetical protein VMU85_15155 [Stellaceae bacterium]|nr:hypothetical protein [Stellaceae bacterium]
MAKSDEVDAILAAADAWARAVDLVAEAERRRAVPGDELDRIADAEMLLYTAIVEWRKANLQSRH